MKLSPSPDTEWVVVCPARLLRGLDQLPPRGAGPGAAPHAAGTEGARAGPVSHLLPQGGAPGGTGPPTALCGRHPQCQQGRVQWSM